MAGRQAVSLVKGTGAGSTGARVSVLALVWSVLANGDRVAAMADAVTDAVQAVTMIVGS